MFGDGALTFQEFAMGEPLPLATIHDAILEFLRGRDDVALYGAQAVNAYVDEARMAQDVGIMSLRAKEFAEEVRQFLNERFQIAARVRDRLIADGASEDVLEEWDQIVAQTIETEDDADEFDY